MGIYLVLLLPLDNLIKLPTFMLRICRDRQTEHPQTSAILTEIWVGKLISLDPVVRNHTGVSVAHEILS